MYSMDPHKLPKKPVVVSQASANQEWERWMAQNDYQRLVDGAGLVWNFHVHDATIPDPAEHQRAVRQLTMFLTGKVTAEKLVATKTLALPDDERLIQQLGSHEIELRMRPTVVSALSLEEARRRLEEHIIDLRSQLKANHLHEVKRQLVGRWLDQERCFGKQLTEIKE